jgi:hypothetical protein
VDLAHGPIAGNEIAVDVVEDALHLRSIKLNADGGELVGHP